MWIHSQGVTWFWVNACAAVTQYVLVFAMLKSAQAFLQIHPACKWLLLCCRAEPAVLPWNLSAYNNLYDEPKEKQAYSISIGDGQYFVNKWTINYYL